MSEQSSEVAIHMATYELIADGESFRALDTEQSMIETIISDEEEGEALEELTLAQKYSWQLYDRYDISTELAFEKFDKFMPIDSRGKSDMEEIRAICSSTEAGAELVRLAAENPDQVSDRKLQYYAADLIFDGYLEIVKQDTA